MNKRNVTATPVKREVKASHRPQEPIQTSPVPPAGDSITVKEFLAKMADRDAKAAESRVEVAERLEAHAQRESILASFCAAVGQPVPAEVTADAVVKLLEKAAWDSRMKVEALSLWLGSLLDAADARHQLAAARDQARKAGSRPAHILAREAVGQARATCLEQLSAESKGSLRELLSAAQKLGGCMSAMTASRREVKRQRVLLAKLEAEAATARHVLAREEAHYHQEKGWASSNMELVEELVEQLERSPAWELIKGMPLGEWADLEELLSFYRRAGDVGFDSL